MQQVVIQYKSLKTLKFLKDVAKHLDFTISTPKKVEEEDQVLNGVTLVKGTKQVNNAEMEKIFTQNNVDAKELRSKWLRKK
jgi:hypothetical protein